MNETTRVGLRLRCGGVLAQALPGDFEGRPAERVTVWDDDFGAEAAEGLLVSCRSFTARGGLLDGQEVTVLRSAEHVARLLR